MTQKSTKKRAKKVRSLTPKNLTREQAKTARGGAMATQVQNNFMSALITETGLPALDASSKDSSSLTVHITTPVFKKP
jgi:hypothetical protein